jgi:uncharacterized secreted protein with C-terminal beta-propeller domain
MKNKIAIGCTALLVVCAILSGFFGPFVGGNIAESAETKLPKPSKAIVSDGKSYSLGKIDTAALNAETLAPVGNMETLLRLLKDRGALYDSEAITNYYAGGAWDDATDGEWMALDRNDSIPLPSAEASESEGAFDANARGGSHSETNEQTEGISEGDIVKTDGRYLYAMANNYLRIISADGAAMKVVSTMYFDDIWGSEFYLMGDKLVVIGNHYIRIDTPMARNERGNSDDVIAIEPYYDWGWSGRNTTVVTIYDITDRANPTQIRRVEQEGWAISTRVMDDVVYLVTNKHVWAPFERADRDIIIPLICDTRNGGEFEPISLDRIYYVPDTEDSSYLIIGTLDINADAPFETNAYLGAGSMLYMSRNSIYVAQTDWGWSNRRIATNDIDEGTNSVTTDILRFGINGTAVSYSGKGVVNGFPINQYSMDEYNGYFRIATTQWGVGTRVTVLDGNMNVTGHTPDLEPNETMQSMRFLGNMGYVVTFENTDPLFTIDLSDPYNPKVLGELKIPGFSQYLHPVGDGYLLGIGRDTTELFVRDPDGTERVVGFQDIGLKVSLFDVRDPYDPKEVEVLRLGDGWAEVSHNPRALMVDSAKGLFGFTMDRWSSNRAWDSRNSPAAVIVSVENGRLSLAKELISDFYTWNSRLAFIGDTLYLVHEKGIRAYNYNSFAETGNLLW